MSEKKTDAEKDARMHEAFSALGLGLRKFNKALDGELSNVEIQAACSDHLTAQPEIREFLQARGLSEFSELDEGGRRALTAHLKRERNQAFRENGWDVPDEEPVMH